MKKLKGIVFRVILVALIAAAGWYAYRYIRDLPQSQREVATTAVRRGDVVVRAYTRGELKAVRSVSLVAPNLFGTVQVTRLAPLGAYAREGDLVMEFDDAEVRSRLEEQQLELEQTDERIKMAEADLEIRKNQDEVELMRAQFSVRRAELEVQRNELLAEIDAKKNTLNLDEANRRLEKLKSDIESRREQAVAELAVLRQQRRRAEVELQQDEARLKQVRVLAPMTGLVAIRQQRSNFFFAGSQLPDIREGDELRPGTPVADILDLSELEVTARVGELDRANLTEGQDVIIHLDALADKDIRGKVKSLSGTATADIYSNDPAKKFDVTFEVDMRELLTTLNASPEQIERTLAQAEQNRTRNVASAGSTGGAASRDFSAMAARGGDAGGSPGGATPGRAAAGGATPGGASPRGAAGGSGASDQVAAGARGGRRRPGGGANPERMLQALPEEQRKQLEADLAGKSLSDLSAEERAAMFQKLGGLTGASQRGGAARGARAPQFTDEQVASAELPTPPGEDSQLDVLLRPGLLADVEIIVEQMPDAIYIPIQAVFEKDAKPVVYVRSDGRFEERVVKPLKRSESTMVIAEGLEEGEEIALADPNARPGDRPTAIPTGPGGGIGGPGMPGMPGARGMPGVPGGGMGMPRGGGGGGGGGRGGRGGF